MIFSGQTSQSFHERCWINHQRQEYFLVLIGASEADHLKYHPFHFVMILSHTNEFSIHHNQSCSPNSHHIYPAFDSANFVVSCLTASPLIILCFYSKWNNRYFLHNGLLFIEWSMLYCLHTPDSQDSPATPADLLIHVLRYVQELLALKSRIEHAAASQLVTRQE